MWPSTARIATGHHHTRNTIVCLSFELLRHWNLGLIVWPHLVILLGCRIHDLLARTASLHELLILLVIIYDDLGTVGLTHSLVSLMTVVRIHWTLSEVVVMHLLVVTQCWLVLAQIIGLHRLLAFSASSSRSTCWIDATLSANSWIVDDVLLVIAYMMLSVLSCGHALSVVACTQTVYSVVLLGLDQKVINILISFIVIAWLNAPCRRASIVNWISQMLILRIVGCSLSWAYHSSMLGIIGVTLSS